MIAIFILLLVPALMVLARLVRPGFAYQWLLATGGALVAWLMTLVAGLDLPAAYQFGWPQPLYTESPLLSIDAISWPFAAAITTLALSVIVTAVARPAPAYGWRNYAATLTLAALGLLAILAGNPLTLLLAWAALDLIEIIILFLVLPDSTSREQVVVAFTARAAGTFVLLWAQVSGWRSNEPVTFASISPTLSIYYLMAAGLRLGVLPPHNAYLKGLPLHSGLGTMLRLTPAAASLVMVARIAPAGVPQPWISILLALTVLTALVASLRWAITSRGFQEWNLWIMATAAFAIASAILAQPSAALSWGLATLLIGGLLHLASVRLRGLILLTGLGAAGLSALPFTPLWEGLRIYFATASPVVWVLFLAQGLLLAGYLHSLRNADQELTVSERWVTVIYPLGLALLPVVHILLGLWIRGGLEPMPVAGWIGGPVLLLLAAILWLTGQRISLPAWLPAWDRLLVMGWIYRLFWSLYRTAGRLVAGFTNILEGEGGILWAMVIVALLVSLLAQMGGEAGVMTGGGG